MSIMFTRDEDEEGWGWWSSMSGWHDYRNALALAAGYDLDGEGQHGEGWWNRPIPNIVWDAYEYRGGDPGYPPDWPYEDELVYLLTVGRFVENDLLPADRVGPIADRLEELTPLPDQEWRAVHAKFVQYLRDAAALGVAVRSH